jgi:hypothetical protein
VVSIKSPTVHLKTGDGQYAKTKTDIAETLAKTFCKNFSSNNYSNDFQQHKSKAEKEHINFQQTMKTIIPFSLLMT